MIDTKIVYYASLLQLLNQTRAYCDAFLFAKNAAEHYVKIDDSQPDNFSEEILNQMSHLLIEQMATIPGMQDLFKRIFLNFPVSDQ